MQISDLEQFYENQQEPTKGALLAMREIIMTLDENVTSEWKYRMPMFCYKRKMFCYLWVDKHSQLPYLGVVEGNRIDHPLLVQGNRARMKILHLDPNADLPVEVVQEILQEALDLYRKGIIKVK